VAEVAVVAVAAGVEIDDAGCGAQDVARIALSQSRTIASPRERALSPVSIARL
jgi:hypothetical protein